MKDLFEHFLITSAYHYYPKNINESDLYFDETIERKNFLKLLEKWTYFENDKLNRLAINLRNLLGLEVLLNESDRNFPSFMLEIILNKKSYNTINIYISFFIPFYHIVELKGSLEKRKIYSNVKLNDKIEGIINKEINEILNYNAFPLQYLEETIPDLTINEEFNFRKAFFTDCYRISFF
ncbi:hypothetical protein TOREUM_20236 [Tenacibaculum litoreum]|uniref:hypothetical protein n=1 Tax=Tenacibaculum litoreum TaxID=321269 RepID=UPI0038931907